MTSSTVIIISLSLFVMSSSPIVGATCTDDAITCGLCSVEPSQVSPLKIVNCRNKNLSSVPKFSAHPVGSTKVYYELTLAGNRLRSIRSDDFVDLRFETLDLSDNPLSSFEPFAFSGHGASLRRLSLSLTPGAEFPVNPLSTLRNLSSLRVTGFSGFSLPTGAFASLSALAELSIIGGGLGWIDVEDLIGQENTLRELRLSGNVLTSVPSSALEVVAKLTLLDLSTNRIQRVGPNAFGGHRAGALVESIDLSSNGLGGSIDRSAFDDVTASLTVLSLKHCQLTDESLESLRRLRALRELRLDFNSIASLPLNLFDEMRALDFLSLNNNRLTNIASNTLHGARETLSSLHLSYNPLDGDSIAVFISHLTALRELYLDGIESLRLGDSSFASPQQKTLQVLSVRYTLVWDDDLWPTLSTLPALQTLKASHCSLMTIPEYAFRRNKALRSIDLGYNIIGPTLSRLQLHGLSSSTLQTLTLDGNQFSAVDRCTFVGFPTSFLFQLGLSVNPLRCADCSMHWLFSTLKAADAIRMSSLTWTCDDGRLFAALTDADFVGCLPVSSSTRWSSCAEPEASSNGSETTSDHRFITLHAQNTSVDGDCLLEWKLLEDASVTNLVIGFTLTFEPTTSFHTTSSAVSPSSSVSSWQLPPSSPLTSRVSEQLPRDSRQYCSVTPGLLLHSDLYRVCLTARIYHTAVHESTPACSLVWIEESIADVAYWNLLLVLAVGCSIGVVAFLVVVVVAVFHRLHRRATAKTPLTPVASWSAAAGDATIVDTRDDADNGNGFHRRSRDFDKPLVSQDSKRYVKRPRRREHPSATTSVFQTDSIDRRTERDVALWPADGDRAVLSAERRARIITMLVAATESRPEVYAEIADSASPGGCAYVGRRRSTGSPEANFSVHGTGPLDSGYSAPELHVYDEIADDTYDVIPVDNTKIGPFVCA